MEYDVVYLVNDFIKEADLEKKKETKKEGGYDIAKLNEEINLLYVAVTRTKNKLHIPETLMPKNFPKSPLITIVKVEMEEEDFRRTTNKKEEQLPKISGIRKIKEKAYTLADKSQTNKEAYKPWTEEMDETLRMLYESDLPIREIATHFARTKGAIISRLKKLNEASE